jgi:hypothetical protein
MAQLESAAEIPIIVIRETLHWSPSTVLVEGLRPTYQWISTQLTRNVQSGARCPDHLPLKLRVGS